jgi:hypothetical protein
MIKFEVGNVHRAHLFSEYGLRCEDKNKYIFKVIDLIYAKGKKSPSAICVRLNMKEYNNTNNYIQIFLSNGESFAGNNNYFKMTKKIRERFNQKVIENPTN